MSGRWSPSLPLVAGRAYHPAQIAGAAAVAAIVAGWAAAQQPDILPGLPVTVAAASSATLQTVLVVVAIGAVLLVPSLWLLFSLFLRGWFDHRRCAAPHPIALSLSARA